MGRCAVFCADHLAKGISQAGATAYTCRNDMARDRCDHTAFSVRPKCPYDVRWEEGVSCDAVRNSLFAVPSPVHAVKPCFQDSMSYSDEAVTSVNGAYQANSIACHTLCKSTPTCDFFTFSERTRGCWLLGADATLHRHKHGYVSGPKACPVGTTAAPGGGAALAPAGVTGTALRGEATTPSPAESWMGQVVTMGTSSLPQVSWRGRMVIALSAAGFGLLCVAGICGSKIYGSCKKGKAKRKMGRRGMYVEHFEDDIGSPCRETTTESSMPLMEVMEPVPPAPTPTIGLAPPLLPAPVLPAVQPVFM